MSELRGLGFQDAQNAAGDSLEQRNQQHQSTQQRSRHRPSQHNQAFPTVPREGQEQRVSDDDVQGRPYGDQGKQDGLEIRSDFQALGANSAQAPNDDDDELGHGPLSFACALDHTYKKDCINCQGARGHRRAHYKIPTEHLSTGVVSFDLSGPHVLAKDKSPKLSSWSPG